MQAKIYAQALYKALQGADSTRQTDVIARLFARMQKKGHGKLARRVAGEHAMLVEKSRRRNACTITVARKEDANRSLQEARNRFPELSLADCEVVVNPALIGGWRLEAQGKIADGSYKRKLVALYNRFSSRG